MMIFRVIALGALPAAVIGAGGGALLHGPDLNQQPMGQIYLASDETVGPMLLAPPSVISSSTGQALPPPGADITGTEQPPTAAAQAAVMDGPVTKTEQQYLAGIRPEVNPATGLPDVPKPGQAISAGDIGINASATAPGTPPLVPAPTAQEVIDSTYTADQRAAIAAAKATDVPVDASADPVGATQPAPQVQ